METAESPQYLLSPAVQGSPPAGLINADDISWSIHGSMTLSRHDGHRFSPYRPELRWRSAGIAHGYGGRSPVVRREPADHRHVGALDVTLTRGIDSDPVKRSLASALVKFAGEIGAVLIAEGVETSQELELLGELGVGEAQGFLLGKPVSLRT